MGIRGKQDTNHKIKGACGRPQDELANKDGPDGSGSSLSVGGKNRDRKKAFSGELSIPVVKKKKLKNERVVGKKERSKSKRIRRRWRSKVKENGNLRKELRESGTRYHHILSY